MSALCLGPGRLNARFSFGPRASSVRPPWRERHELKLHGQVIASSTIALKTTGEVRSRRDGRRRCGSIPGQDRLVCLPRTFRKAHNHHQTFAATRRLQADVRVVAFGNRPYDGKTEATATSVVRHRSGIRASIEAVEHAGLLALRNAGTVVDDAQLRRPVTEARLDIHNATRQRVSQSV